MVFVIANQSLVFAGSLTVDGYSLDSRYIDSDTCPMRSFECTLNQNNRNNTPLAETTTLDGGPVLSCFGIIPLRNLPKIKLRVPNMVHKSVSHLRV